MIFFTKITDSVSVLLEQKSRSLVDPVDPICNDSSSLNLNLRSHATDAQGQRIQASVRKNVIPTFEKLLVEGGSICMSNFFVHQNVGSYKILDNPYKINLHKLTAVKVIEKFCGSIHGFRFVSFPDMSTGKVENNTTVDVIGKVSGYSDVIIGDKNGSPNQRMDVQLQDIDGNKMKVTFWDSYVDDFKAKIDNDKAAVNVMIVQFAKLREWKGNFSVSHGFNVARIFMNNNIDEIIAFKKSFVDKNGDEVANHKMISLADPSTEAFFTNTKCVQLFELDTIFEATSCVAVATIQSIETDQPWYYIACRKCNKKVTTNNPEDEIEVVGDVRKNRKTTHDCPDCGPDVNVISRFKVQIKLKDASGAASLVFFDRDVVKLIMKTAHSLVDKCAGAESYPEDLDAMIGKKVMVKFDVTQFNLNNNYQVYTVSRMTQEEVMFKTFYKLSMIEMEFQNQCEQAKAAETYNDALDATDAILGVCGNDKVVEVDESVANHQSATGSTIQAATSGTTKVIAASDDAIVDNHGADKLTVHTANTVPDVDTTDVDAGYASPPPTKRAAVDAMESNLSIPNAPKKPKRKAIATQK